MFDAIMCIVDFSNFVIHRDGALMHIAFKPVQLLQCKTSQLLLPEL